MTKAKSILNMSVVLAILIGWGGQSSADEALREMDFAYGRKIMLGSDSPLYRFSLDTHIYRNVVDKRLVDLRVFNSQNEIVPLRIRRAGTQVSKKFQEQKLPFFPIYTHEDSVPGDLTLDLKSNSTEGAFNLKLPDNKEPSADLSGFIIDLGEEAKSPERLVMTFAPGRKEHRLAVKVSCSNELSDWQELVPNAALVRMKFNGQLLERNHIDLPVFSGRYLRLAFHTPFKGRFRGGIIGLFPISPFMPSRHSTMVAGTRLSTDPVVYTYDSGGFFPTDRVQLRLPVSNTLIKVRLSSRTDTESPWRYHKTAIFYRLKVEGAEMENAPVVMPENQDRLFRLEIIAGAVPVSSNGPKLVLSWRPHECAFVASGDPPFMLAYGNADLLYEPQVVNDLLEAIGAENRKRYMGFSRLDSPQVLGGDARLQSSGNSKKVRLRAILWTVLLLSAAGLSFMAHHLYRQMEK